MNLPSGVMEGENLSGYNTWKVGGGAQYFLMPHSLVDLKLAYEWALAQGLPITVISTGSNVLISDRGIRGLVICMRSLNGIEDRVEGDRLLINGFAGTSKAEALKIFLRHKLPPALFLTGLPGDLGGGVVMNAGVSEERKPREFCEIIDWVEVMKPKANGREVEIVRFQKQDLTWAYRHSGGWQPGVIIRVGMSWPMTPDPEIMVKIKEATRNRILRQPLDKPSCGSTFRNPVGDKAGRLIEQAGLKGYAVGGAQVSSKHANFIVTEPGAKASDVHGVIESVRAQVKAKFGVNLETEVVYLGDW